MRLERMMGMKKRSAVLVLVLCAVLGWMTAAQADSGSDKYTVTYHVNLPMGDSLNWDGITDDIKNAYNATTGLLLAIQNGNILQPPPSGSNR